jgi:hypothetical protein
LAGAGEDASPDVRPDTTSSVRISVETYDGIRGYQHYGDVWVGDRDSDYKIYVIKTAQDVSTLPRDLDGIKGLYDNAGWGFSTNDHDVDGNLLLNCAGYHGGGGGWWYNWCSSIYVNGIYGETGGGMRLSYNNHIYITNSRMSVMRN